MNMFVLTLTGFVAAMGIPAFIIAAAEGTASSFKDALRPVIVRHRDAGRAADFAPHLRYSR